MTIYQSPSFHSFPASDSPELSPFGLLAYLRLRLKVINHIKQYQTEAFSDLNPGAINPKTNSFHPSLPSSSMKRARPEDQSGRVHPQTRKFFQIKPSFKKNEAASSRNGSYAD